jgi:diacylglycerol kinase
MLSLALTALHQHLQNPQAIRKSMLSVGVLAVVVALVDLEPLELATMAVVVVVVDICSATFLHPHLVHRPQ